MASRVDRRHERTWGDSDFLTVESQKENPMALSSLSEVRDVTGVTDRDLARIRDFLQGAVYCWCKNRADEWFSLRDLMGGENFQWQGTPLLALYEKHQLATDAVERAG